jgi:acylphosphatase
VTGEAQGDSSALKEFQQHINKGPSAATVTKLHVDDIETKEGEKDFTQ